MNAAARHVLGPLVGAALLIAVVAPSALAADSSGVTFGEPEASSKYAEQIEFVQPVSLDRAVDRAEVRLTFADSTSPLVVEMPGLPAGNQSGGSNRHGRSTGHAHLRGRPLRLERARGRPRPGPLVRG
jgi:hypothetical protein